MRTVIIEPYYDSWRDAARELLLNMVRPEDVIGEGDSSMMKMISVPKHFVILKSQDLGQTFLQAKRPDAKLY